jgi:hypothetical protein
VGDERYISRKGKEIQRNMRSRFGDWLIESFQAVLHRSWPLTNWIGAHDMDNYVERLEEIALARKDLRQSQELTKQSFISRIFGSGKKPAE